MSALLALDDVYTAYGLSRVLFGISLAIEPGECVCLLGRNGVGKTTTIRSVMGLTPPSSGRVLWKGRDITGWTPHRAARAGIAPCHGSCGHPQALHACSAIKVGSPRHAACCSRCMIASAKASKLPTS